MARSVLITGANSGFGAEVSLYLAERGFQVYASMRNLERRADLEAEAERRKVCVRVVQLDVTDPASIDAAVRAIVAESGPPYGLINNAGLFMRGFFEDLLDEEVRRVLETNLFGTMAVTRAVLPHMRAARRGRIVVITSVAGRIGAPTGSAYSASKFGLEGFAESLMQEIAPLGLKVSVIEPGITKTETWTKERSAARNARNPESPYFASFCRAEELFDRTMQSSPIQTMEVARAVHHALVAPRPRLRYVVGRRAALAIAARRYVPDALFERFYFGEVMRRISAGTD